MTRSPSGCPRFRNSSPDSVRRRSPDLADRSTAGLESRAGEGDLRSPRGRGRRPAPNKGFEVAAFRPLADHCAYSPTELSALEAWAAAADARAVLCTKKDLVKLTSLHLGGRPLWALEIELTIDAGRDDFAQRLSAIRQQLA